MRALQFDDTWLSRLLLFGLVGLTKPHHYREILGVLWQNKTELPYAWNVLNHGICDGCSLGIHGLRDDLLDGMHLCMTRLKLLKFNTMGALDASVLSDVARLRKLDQEKLRCLGRLPYPMLRRRNDKGFLRIRWEDAFDALSKWIRATAPNEMGFLATSRRLTNEVYYVVQKLARTLGTNNVGFCAPLGPDAAVTGLKNTLGIGAATCSFGDFIGTDLLVLFGTNLADHQPVTTKYVEFAKQQGTRIVMVNSARQYGLGAPVLSYSLLGDNFTDDLFPVRAGGDIAFLNGVLKGLLAANQFDDDYIARHTSGVAELKRSLERQSWEMLERRSGLARAAMERFAGIYGKAKTAVLVYSKGLTRHEFSVNNVDAVVNLALARGMLGREKCGIMPLGGHSGGPGAHECGVLPDEFPGGFAVNEENARRFSNLWRHPVSAAPGLTVPQVIEAAHREKISFLYSIGANLLEAIPDHAFAAEAIARVPFRVHQDLILNSSMLLDPQESVLLLPGQSRYEQRTGGTSTTSDRRIRFMSQIPGHQLGESLPEWEIPTLIGRKTMSNGELLFPFNNTQSIREEMARVMPIYQGIEKLGKEGDQLQWGGSHLFKDGFSNMPNYRARFTVLEPPDRA